MFKVLNFALVFFFLFQVDLDLPHLLGATDLRFLLSGFSLSAVVCSVGSVDPVKRSAATSGYWVSDG